MALTASKLREDIYNMLDSVIETGEPVEIERKGKLLRIVLETPPASRIARMKVRLGMTSGNPADLAEVDWSSHWNPEGNL